MKEGGNFCQACGTAAVGVAVEKADDTPWSTGAYIGLLIVSFIIPLFGLIFGGIYSKKAEDGSKRKEQAGQYVIAGILGVVLNAILMLMD